MPVDGRVAPHAGEDQEPGEAEEESHEDTQVASGNQVPRIKVSRAQIL